MKTSLKSAIKYLLPLILGLGGDCGSCAFLEDNVVHYAGGLRVLADGDRMAVKEKRALADGILTPFCVFLFGGGREGGSFNMVQQSCKLPMYLFPYIF